MSGLESMFVWRGGRLIKGGGRGGRGEVGVGGGGGAEMVLVVV